MLKVEIIGNLGADAEIKESNGSKFVVMRVAHTSKYTDQNGQPHESTTWVDVTLNNAESKVIPATGHSEVTIIAQPATLSLKHNSEPTRLRRMAEAL